MKQPNYEQALSKAGVKWEYVEQVPFDEINQTRGRQMQARLEPLDHDLIDRYAEMLVDGFAPPPLLLWRHGKSKLVPLDGNQRIAANEQVAARYKLKAIDAYVVDSDDQMVVDRLCWQWNNYVNGRRLSYEESLEHAITFVRKYNQPPTKTAREWGVKAWELEKQVRVLGIREMGAKKGVDSINVADGIIANLAPLGKLGDDVVVRVLKVCADSGIAEGAVTELVSDVTKARTLENKTKLIDDFASSDKVATAKASTKNGKIITKQGRLPRQMLAKHLDQLEHLLDEYKQEAFKPVGKDERERYSGAALFVANKLIAIYGLGSLLKGQGVA